MKFRLNNIFLHDVTGITLEQFRILQDTYQFFDPIVFDESQEEDIFDYIPPQKTNQIFLLKM